MKEFAKVAGITLLAIILAVLATLAVIKWEGHRFLPQTYDSSVQVTQADIKTLLSCLLLTLLNFSKK